MFIIIVAPDGAQREENKRVRVKSGQLFSTITKSLKKFDEKMQNLG